MCVKGEEKTLENLGLFSPNPSRYCSLKARDAKKRKKVEIRVLRGEAEFEERRMRRMKKGKRRVAYRGADEHILPL